jgi:hypothetical protein
LGGVHVIRIRSYCCPVVRFLDGWLCHTYMPQAIAKFSASIPI